MYILCRNRATASERKYAAVSEYIYFFYVEDPRKFQANSVTIMFDAAPAWVAFSQFLISFFSLFWYPASSELHCPSRMLWKIFSRFCAETVNENIQLIFFYIEASVWLLLETFQWFLKNVGLLLKKILRKNGSFWNVLKKNMLLRIMSTLRNEMRTD